MSDFQPEDKAEALAYKIAQKVVPVGASASFASFIPILIEILNIFAANCDLSRGRRTTGEELREAAMSSTRRQRRVGARVARRELGKETLSHRDAVDAINAIVDTANEVENEEVQDFLDVEVDDNLIIN